MIKRVLISSALVALCICFHHRPWQRLATEASDVAKNWLRHSSNDVISVTKLYATALPEDDVLDMSTTGPLRRSRNYVPIEPANRLHTATHHLRRPNHSHSTSRRLLFDETTNKIKAFVKAIKDFFHQLRIEIEYWIRGMPPGVALLVVVVLFLATLICCCILCVCPVFCCYERCVVEQDRVDRRRVEGVRPKQKVNILDPEYEGSPTKRQFARKLAKWTKDSEAQSSNTQSEESSSEGGD